jgi:ribosomal protein S11
VGTADDVAEVIDEYRTKLGMTTLSVAVDGPGTTRESIEEQLTLVAEEVAPRLGVTMTGPGAVAA